MESKLTLNAAQMATLQFLRAFLAACTAPCFDFQAAAIRIGNATYPALRYSQTVQPPNGARSPAPYTITAWYVVGDLPASYRRSGRTVYDCGGLHYIGGYITADKLTEQNKEFHPVGAWFSLYADCVENGVIEQNQPRRPMQIAHIDM